MTASRVIRLLVGWTLLYLLLGSLGLVLAAVTIGGGLPFHTWHAFVEITLPGLVAAAMFAPTFLAIGVRVASPGMRTFLATCLGIAAGVLGTGIVDTCLGISTESMDSALRLGDICGAIAGLCSGLAAKHWSPRSPARP